MAATTYSKLRHAVSRAPRLRLDGIPLHADNQSVINEWIYLDKADPNIPSQPDQGDRPCLEASMDGDQKLSPQPSPRPVWSEYEVTWRTGVLCQAEAIFRVPAILNTTRHCPKRTSRQMVPGQAPLSPASWSAGHRASGRCHGDQGAWRRAADEEAVAIGPDSPCR